MQRSLTFALFAVSALLTGCAFFQGHPPLPVFFANMPEQLDKRIIHQVIWKEGNTTETFIAVLETHADAIQLVGITPTGLSLFSVNQTPEKQLLETSIMFPAIIKPNVLLAYLQLMNYPAETLQNQLTNNWSLENTDHQLTLYYNNSIQAQLQWLTPSPLTAQASPNKNTRITFTQLSIEDAK